MSEGPNEEITASPINPVPESNPLAKTEFSATTSASSESMPLSPELSTAFSMPAIAEPTPNDLRNAYNVMDEHGYVMTPKGQVPYSEVVRGPEVYGFTTDISQTHSEGSVARNNEMLGTMAREVDVSGESTPRTEEQSQVEIELYPTPRDDPSVLLVEATILKVTNSDSQVMRASDGNGLDSYNALWNRVNMRENIHQWLDWVRKNPDKAEVYAKGHEGIRRAYEYEQENNAREKALSDQRPQRVGVPSAPKVLTTPNPALEGLSQLTSNDVEPINDAVFDIGSPAKLIPEQHKAMSASGREADGMSGSTFEILEPVDAVAPVDFVRDQSQQPKNLPEMPAVGNDLEPVVAEAKLGEEVGSVGVGGVEEFAVSESVPVPSRETYGGRLLEYLTGLSLDKPKAVIERLTEDCKIVRTKYDLPDRAMRFTAPVEYERLLRNMATQAGVSIRPTMEFGTFFTDHFGVGGVNDEKLKRIGVDIDINTRDEYERGLGVLEHELIHTLQATRYPSMPIELMEYEAYVAGADFTHLQDENEVEQRESLEAFFSILPGGSVNHWYQKESEREGKMVSPKWNNPIYFERTSTHEQD